MGTEFFDAFAPAEARNEVTPAKQFTDHDIVDAIRRHDGRTFFDALTSLGLLDDVFSAMNTYRRFSEAIGDYLMRHPPKFTARQERDMAELNARCDAEAKEIGRKINAGKINEEECQQALVDLNRRRSVEAQRIAGATPAKHR